MRREAFMVGKSLRLSWSEDGLHWRISKKISQSAVAAVAHGGVVAWISLRVWSLADAVIDRTTAWARP